MSRVRVSVSSVHELLFVRPFSCLHSARLSAFFQVLTSGKRKIFEPSFLRLAVDSSLSSFRGQEGSHPGDPTTANCQTVEVTAFLILEKHERAQNAY